MRSRRLLIPVILFSKRSSASLPCENGGSQGGRSSKGRHWALPNGWPGGARAAYVLLDPVSVKKKDHSIGAPQWGQNLVLVILPQTGQTEPSSGAVDSAFSAASRLACSSAIFS